VLGPSLPALGVDPTHLQTRDAITDAKGSDAARLDCQDARCLHVYWANYRVVDCER